MNTAELGRILRRHARLLRRMGPPSLGRLAPRGWLAWWRLAWRWPAALTPGRNDRAFECFPDVAARHLKHARTTGGALRLPALTGHMRQVATLRSARDELPQADDGTSPGLPCSGHDP